MVMTLYRPCKGARVLLLVCLTIEYTPCPLSGAGIKSRSKAKRHKKPSELLAGLVKGTINYIVGVSLTVLFRPFLRSDSSLVALLRSSESLACTAAIVRLM